MIENKLRGSTDFTPAQKLKFSEVKNAADGSKVDFVVKFEQRDEIGELIFAKWQSLKVSKERVVRISDHGENTVSNVTSEDLALIKDLDI